MLLRRRKQNQFRTYRKWLLYLSLIMLGLMITFLLLDDRYFLISRRIRRFIYESSDEYRQAINIRYGKIFNRSKADLLYSQVSSFQPSISPYHPHLPIHLFTQNITSLKNVTKLILLANDFFEHQQWGLNPMEKSSTQLMTQLSCPFLSDYCDITSEKYLFPHADAVVFHMRNEIDQSQAERFRRPEQRFVFALWESPTYTPDLQSFNRFFNWTMTYRFRSDIIAAYYFGNGYIHKSSSYYQLMIQENVKRNLHLNFKTVDHQLSDEILANKRLGTAAALISNCGGSSRRVKFILRLKKYIDVTVYGNCGIPCPPDINCREFIAKNYYFYLSYENSLCQDYTTEKLFSTLEYPIIPVVYGRTNYSYFLPSSAFIDVNDFDNIITLAQYLNQTRYDKEKYLSYFSWKKDYVWGLMSLFTPLCDLCLRLHLDSTPNIIEDMNAWWNENTCDRPRKFDLLKNIYGYG